MRVTIVSGVFPPEPVVSSRTSAEIAQALVKSGAEVRVITSFPSRPSGKLYPGFVRSLLTHERRVGSPELIRCFTLLSDQSSMLSRFLENISFGLVAASVVLFGPRPDVIYSNTWPIFATGFLSLVAHFRQIPMVISVQDIYPESLVSQGRISYKSLLARIMHAIDQHIARGSQAVIVISESFATIYRNSRGVSSQRLQVVPNWVDPSSVLINDCDTQFRESHCIPHDAFVASYGGNIGPAAGVETIINARQYLTKDIKVYLVIAGEGTNLESYRSMVKERAGDRVVFHTPYPLHENAMVLGAADVLILPTRGQISLASVPSKLISYMLSARPIIALAMHGSDLAKVIETSGCGWVIEPDRPDLLAAKITEVCASGVDERINRGQAGRAYALNHFTTGACLPKVIHTLEQAAQHIA